MKKTVKKDLIKKAEQLNTIKEQLKELKKQEASLKSFFKDDMLQNDIDALQVGPFLLTIKEVKKEPIDNSKLKDFLQKCNETLDNFKKERLEKHFEIKKVA